MNLSTSKQSLSQPRSGERAIWIKRAFVLVLLMVLACAANPVFANCSYIPSYPGVVNKANNITSSITAGRDLPVGSVLYIATLDSASARLGSFPCSADTYYITRDYVSTPYPVSNYTDPTYGKVYKTPIQGVGVVYTVGSTRPLPFSVGPYSTSVNVGVTPEGTVTNYNIRLIKISDPMGTGTINGSDLPTSAVFIRNAANTVKLNLSNNTIAGQVVIAPSTCITPDRPISMGTHLTTELKGKGSTTSQWVGFQIQLNNCPAYFGYKSTTTSYDRGTVSTVISRLNSIQYSIAPSNGVADGPNGVMNLSNGGASGIGIQLANSAGTPLQFNTKIDSGLSLNQANSASYVINLNARYFQTGTSVTAGAANATATVTLTYL